MKSNSFRLPSKATAVLLLCTGLVASHPLALWAEDGVTTVQAVATASHSERYGQ